MKEAISRRTTTVRDEKRSLHVPFASPVPLPMITRINDCYDTISALNKTLRDIVIGNNAIEVRFFLYIAVRNST